ncbi:MAG: AraC family transcriptional regulator [Nostocoides sp.]
MTRLSKLGFIDTRRTRTPVRRRVQSRGVPVALRDHEVFRTEDRREASDLLQAFVGRCTLILQDPQAAPFQASMHAVRIRDVTLAHLDLHAPASLDITATGMWYSIHMPTSGSGSVRLGTSTEEISPYRALVTNPGDQLYLTMDLDSPHVVLRIEADALETAVARMRGRTSTTPIRFAPIMDLTSDVATRWHTAMQLLSSEILNQGSLLHQGAGAGPVEDFVISTLLLIQPSSHHHDLVREHTRSGRPAVRRSIAYIEQNIARAITLDDLARHARMSRRSIQQGFRADLGTTPMAYVRDLRLDRVRAQLADALPEDGVTVTEVAQSWGFTHLGNFAALYRRRFGETPSLTLRK